MIWTLGFNRSAILQAITAAADGWRVELRAQKRSDAQNRRLWAMLRDISRQCTLAGRHWDEDDWKSIILKAVKREVRFLPDTDGGFFPAGNSSSKLTVKEMTLMQDFMQAYGDEQGVAWSDPSQRQDDGR